MSFFKFVSLVAACAFLHELRYFFSFSVLADPGPLDDLFWILCFAAPLLLVLYMHLSPSRSIWYRLVQFGLGLGLAALLYLLFVPLEPADSTFIDVTATIVSIDNWFVFACFLFAAFSAWRERPAHEHRLALADEGRTDEWGLPIID